MEHHPLSMSNWPKWDQCPCAMSGGGETAEAASGTRSHSWLAHLIDRANGIEPPEPQGVTADEKARAEWAYGEISAIFGSYRPQSERRVTIRGLGVLDGIYGTADAIGVLPDRILVADFKAYSVNDTDLTAQLIGYGVAVASDLPFPPDVIETVVLHGGSREVERRTVTLAEAEERARLIVSRHIDNADNTDLATPNHFCQYCKRLGTCPAADRAIAVVNDGPRFMSLPLAEQLVVAKQVKSICERVEKSVKAELDAQIERGVPVDSAVVSGGSVSWRYVMKPGKDRLADICGLAGEIGSHGVSQETLMSICSVSKTAVCERLLAANPGMKASEAKRIVKPYYEAGKPSKWLERVA